MTMQDELSEQRGRRRQRLCAGIIVALPLSIGAFGWLAETRRLDVATGATTRQGVSAVPEGPSKTRVVEPQPLLGRAALGQPIETDTFRTARIGLAQAITLLDSQATPTFPISSAAYDALWPFHPYLLDPSPANIGQIEQRAIAGSEDALAAFMTVAAHLPDYRERSQQLLVLNAARGSVIALTTLSERAVNGFGFGKADRATSIFFEYLAWTTGQWHSDAATDNFRPSIASRYSPGECESAIAFGKVIARQSDSFAERDVSGPANCID